MREQHTRSAHPLISINAPGAYGHSRMREFVFGGVPRGIARVDDRPDADGASTARRRRAGLTSLA